MLNSIHILASIIPAVVPSVGAMVFALPVGGGDIWPIGRGIGKTGVPVWTPLPLAEWRRLLNRHSHSGDLSYIHIHTYIQEGQIFI